MPIKPKLKACVLALMLAVPLSAGAVGLGRLNVLSGLGQPFRAEIDLVSVQPGEAETLVARLAPAEAFARAQVAYPPAAMGLRLTIEKRANGQSFVSVSSAQSVSEPFLDLLINLKWADGQIQREYTALIDPVGYTPSAAGTNNARPGEQFAPSALPGTRRRGAIKAPARVAPAKAAADQPAADNQSADNKYKVKAGDTLSAVARQNMEEGVSLEQMLVGLYRQNPDAFDGNMNRLRRGRILNIPAKEALQAVAPKEAGQEVRLQSKDWQAYRSKLAESVQKRQPVAGNESANTGKISPKVEEKLAPGGAKQDVLKLSKGDAPGKAKGDSAAQDKLRALEEEVAARQKGLDESNQRVAELQKNLHDMEKLLALKSRAGTELQQASQAAAPAPTEVPAEPVVAASAAASAPAEAVAPVEASEVAAPKKKIRRPVPVVAPEPEPGILDVVLDNSLPIGGGLAAILLGGAGIWWSRRRKQGSAFADSVLTGGDLKSNTLLGNTGGAIISTQPTENSFLTDFSRQGLGTIDTDEVDPIAEAEVYMAYDRNEQAEEILRDALAKDPSRHEIRLKLLEIFSAKKDRTSFEEIAADLFALTAGKGAQWEQAAYQGRLIDPENPLYREQEPSAAAPAAVVAAATAATASAFDVFDLEIDEPAPKDADTMLDFAGANAPDAPDLSGAVSDSPGDLDFSLDFDSAEPQAVPELVNFNAPAEPEALPEAYQKPLADFDFLPSEAEPAPEVAAETPAEPGDDFGMGLDFGLDDFLVPDDEKKPAEPVTIPKPATDDMMLDLDLPVDFSAPAAEEPASPQAAPAPVAPQAEALAFDDPFDLDFTGLDGVSESAVIPAAVPDLPDLNLDALPSLEDFSIDELALPETPQPAEEILEATSADDGMGLDFDFSLDAVPETPAPATAEAPLDLGDLGLNFDAGTDFAADAVAEFAGDDPVQTKIDLAKAYLDMGDTEGAREILQEALSEGNPAQQKQAQALLGNL